MITVIMRTNGMNPKLIGEAIASIFNQSYTNFKLLIVNSHPDNLILDCADSRITVVNYQYKTLALHTADAIAMVETPWWCIVDSDDIILKNHLQNMIQNIKKTNSVFRPRIVGNTLAIEYSDNKIIGTLHAGGWWKYAFETAMIDKIYSLAIHHDTQWGFDSKILYLPEWNIYTYESIPTYIYRYNVSYHVSKRLQTKPYIYESLPIITPQLYNDYETMAKEYFK